MVSKTDNSYWLHTDLVGYEWVQNGHSGGTWEIYSSPFLQHFNAIGDTLSAYMSHPWCRDMASYWDSSGYYFAYFTYQGGLKVVKYNETGSVVWQQTYLGNYPWYYSSYNDRENVSIARLSDNEIIISGASKQGSSIALVYLVINPDGVLYPAQDNQFAITNMSSFATKICSTRMGCYLLSFDHDGYYAGIRFKASGAASSVIDPGTQSPAIFRLSPAFPNPSGQDSKFKLDLQDSGLGKMEVYNLRGQKVMQKDLLDLERGAHILSWNGMDNNGKLCSNGIYFIRVNLNGYSQTIKVVRIK
jgi:hypothetical protein